MIEARPGRRVIISEYFQIVPFKQLISPLLLVNRESRRSARAFYNVQVRIYPVLTPRDDDLPHLDK
jgi:hypothetical protein